MLHLQFKSNLPHAGTYGPGTIKLNPNHPEFGGGKCVLAHELGHAIAIHERMGGELGSREAEQYASLIGWLIMKAAGEKSNVLKAAWRVLINQPKKDKYKGDLVDWNVVKGKCMRVRLCGILNSYKNFTMLIRKYTKTTVSEKTTTPDGTITEKTTTTENTLDMELAKYE